MVKSGKKAKKTVYVCPICGKPMDETELSRMYCWDCAQKLKEKEDFTIKVKIS